MDLRSLLQDILNEVSSRKISFQMGLHLLITLVRSSEYFRFIESLRTCIMASQLAPNTLEKDLKIRLKPKINGIRKPQKMIHRKATNNV